MTSTKIALTTLALASLALPAMAQEYCREYTRDVQIGGHVEKAYGTACLAPDGQWRITSEDTPNGATAQPVVQTVVVEQPVQRVIYRERYANPYPFFNVIWHVGSNHHGYRPRHHERSSWQEARRHHQWERRQERGHGRDREHGNRH